MKQKIKQDNKAIATIAIILVVAAVVAATGATTYYYAEEAKSGDIDPDDIVTGSSTYKPRVKKQDIREPTIMEQVLVYLDLSEYKDITDELNVQVYTLDGTTVTETITEYKQKMKEDGYEVIIEETRSGTGWSGTFLFAKALLHGRGIVAVSGTSVTQVFKCDVLLIT